MQTFNSIGAAANAVRQFVYTQGLSLDEELRAKLETAIETPSPVKLVCEAAELLYARREDLDADCCGLAAGLASFAGQYGFHGMAENDRGAKMVAAIRRDLGEDHPAGGDWPEADDDPDPVHRFKKPAPPPTEEEEAKADDEADPKTDESKEEAAE